jgi:hypothetical protein
MMNKTLAASIAIALGLAGCSSTPELSPAEQRAILLSQKPAIDSVPSSGLGPQTVAVGECALFLWSKTDTTKFIFFSKALSGVATFAQGEEPLTLTQTSAGGDIFGQFNTRTQYLALDGRELSLSLEPGEVMIDGQRIEDGLIRLNDAEGWQTVLPVVGVRACQPE